MATLFVYITMAVLLGMHTPVPHFFQKKNLPVFMHSYDWPSCVRCCMDSGLSKAEKEKWGIRTDRELIL